MSKFVTYGWKGTKLDGVIRSVNSSKNCIMFSRISNQLDTQTHKKAF